MMAHCVRNYFFLLLFPVLIALACSGCSRKNDILLNPDFSVNMGTPGKKFPKKDNLAQAKREVYEMYGVPDFIRLWWSKDGRIHRYLEVDRKLRSLKILDELKHSWIYLEDNLEFVFDSDTTYQENPLDDKIRTICSYGDPEDIKRITTTVPYKETWNYYSLGLILSFSDGKLVKEQRHHPMGNVIKR